MDGLQAFFLAMLIAPAAVLVIAALPRSAHGQQTRLDMEGFLTLATAPHSTVQVFVLQRASLAWFWFVYMTIGLVMSFGLMYFGWREGRWRRRCEVTFSLLYFGLNWLVYTLGFCIPPI